MPKIFGAKGLSADEISAALQGGTTTGTSTALVATVPGSPSLSDGLLVMVELHTATGSFPTLNLNSLGAKLLYKGTQSGVTGLESGQLPQFSKALLMFSTTLDGWFVLSGLKSVAADIPSTLNATTFPGITLTGFSAQITGAAGYATLDLNSNVGARLLYSGGYGFLSDGGTAKITNGTVRFECGDNGVVAVSPVVSVGTSFTTVCAVSGNQALIVATVTGTGSILLEWNGSTLTKLAGVATLVVAGSAGAGETAFRVSGGNLQAIVDTGTRNVSSGFSVRH